MFNNYTPEERQRLLEEQDGLVNSINTLKQSEETKKVVVVELDEEIAKKQSQLAGLFDKIEEQKELQKTVVQAGEDAKATFNNEAEEITQELANLIESSEEKTEKIKELDELIAATAKEHEATVSKNKNEVAKMNDEFAEVASKINSGNAAIAKITETIFDFEKKYETILKNIDEAQETLEKVTAQIDADAKLSIKRTNEAEAQVAAKNTEAEAFDEKIATLKEIVVDLMKEKEKVEKETDSKAEALQLLTENEDNLRKFSIHVQNKEEHLREMYEEIGKTYPEYKN